MNLTRCVIANMPQHILADILENLANYEFEIVKRLDAIANIEEIFSSSDEDNIDLAVVGINSADLTPSFYNFLNSNIDISVIAIIDGGAHMAAFINNFGTSDLLKAMRLISRTKSINKH